MKAKAIVYTSNTGYTAEYARILSRETGLLVYSLEQARKELAAGSCILYLGWLMAGKVQGYDKAAKLYAVAAVCGVGMGATGSQLEDVRRTNGIGQDIPVFTLQGGFDGKRLKGIYKMMMSVMAKTLGKKMAQKPNRTPEEDDMLDLLQNGGSRVKEDNLNALFQWYYSDKAGERSPE